jgi:hypothetical protein
MKLSECIIGTIVTNINEQQKRVNGISNRLEGFTHYLPFERVGYISGLTQNATGETIPLVQWSDTTFDEPMHHSQIEKYMEK